MLFRSAIILIWPAQYEAWRDKRLELLEERGRNSEADLAGEVLDGFMQVYAAGGSRAHTYFLLNVRVVNRRSQNTTVRKVSLALRGASFTYSLEGISIPVRLAVERPMPDRVGVMSVVDKVKLERPSNRQLLDVIAKDKLPRGEGREGWLLFRLQDVLLAPEVSRSECVLTLVDDLGKEHQIKRDPGEWPNKIAWAD